MAAAVLSAPRTDVDGVGKRSFSRVDGITSTSASASRTYPGELAYFLPVPIHTLARNTPASSLECIKEERSDCVVQVRRRVPVLRVQGEWLLSCSLLRGYTQIYTSLFKIVEAGQLVQSPNDFDFSITDIGRS